MTGGIPFNEKNDSEDKADIKGSQNIQWKTLATLGAATVLLTSQLAGCDSTDKNSKGATEDASMAAMLPSGKGEDEGSLKPEAQGEGEGAATESADFSTDDAAYLTQLGLIRGHLQVGHQLYKEKLPKLAETHMKHPRAEIYSSLVPAFAKRGCPGFADGLTALSQAVTERQLAGKVSETYDELLQEINQCEKAASIGDAKVAAKVIEQLLRTAGVEYQIGVIDGEIDNLHEYQDAWGFTQVAQEWAQSPAFKASTQAQVMNEQALAVIAKLQSLWPSLNPEGSLDGEAAPLFGAAARIQVLALSLDADAS